MPHSDTKYLRILPRRAEKFDVGVGIWMEVDAKIGRDRGLPALGLRLRRVICVFGARDFRERGWSESLMFPFAMVVAQILVRLLSLARLGSASAGLARIASRLLRESERKLLGSNAKVHQMCAGGRIGAGMHAWSKQ